MDLIKGRFDLGVPCIQLSNDGDSASRKFFDYFLSYYRKCDRERRRMMIIIPSWSKPASQFMDI